MPYQYDVFVSVKWDETFAAWMREHFLPPFTTYLKNAVIVECGRPLGEIFYYKEDIEPGDAWKKKLKKGIKESRCAVALCSPEYFFSDYCLLEWHSFAKRGEKVGTSLIVPAAIHDGKAFPDYAKDIQEARLQEYVIPGEGFPKTPRYVEYTDKLKKFAESVAKRIKAAPEFADWPIAEPERLAPAERPKIKQETL
jgi:hypothetical protein